MTTIFVLLLFVCSMTADAIHPNSCTYYDYRSQVGADCTSKGLTNVPSGLHGNVTSLKMGYNNLTALRNDSLEDMGLSSLVRLELNDNLLATIETATFHVVPELTRLDLENNRLRVLHPDTFRPLTHLWKLILSGNPLQLPAEGPYLMAPHLQILELERCGLQQLPLAAFQNLSGLVTLRLTDNALSSVHLSSDNLAHIALGGNPLSEEELQLTVPNLLVLDLAGCGLERFPGNLLRETPLLNRLKLERNAIRTLDTEVIHNLTYLREINVSSNILSSLNVNTFQQNDNLNILDLSNNPLQVPDEDTFLDVASLTALSLAGCNLTRISQSLFRGLPNITKLKLSNNRIRSLDKAVLRNLPRLESLHVDGNRIRIISSDLISDLLKIINLDMSRNILRFPTETAFLESPSLQVLKLDDCGLETIPAVSFRLLPNLRSLSLSENLLTTLSVDVVRDVPKLNSLSFHKNPLICNCSLLPLWHWCSDRQCDDSVVRCARPRERTWNVVRDLVCEDESPTVSSEEFDVNLEVELVEHLNPSRPPPNRLTDHVST